ncbi:unnamed protein product [Ambrosiozyma monospora]|uniref:Unnamed protein product n=1 Tax=Ambrosiozyma monospora TaxID=43982 RepID=A0ACB5T259_AMBMO|nr:unnamed protein product [Ambrosiozyma monospora]
MDQPRTVRVRLTGQIITPATLSLQTDHIPIDEHLAFNPTDIELTVNSAGGLEEPRRGNFRPFILISKQTKKYDETWLVVLAHIALLFRESLFHAALIFYLTKLTTLAILNVDYLVLQVFWKFNWYIREIFNSKGNAVLTKLTITFCGPTI